MKYAALLLLASCGTLNPDRFELSPYYGRGQWESARPLFDGVETPTYGLALVWGWDLSEDDAAIEVRKLRAALTTSSHDSEPRASHPHSSNSVPVSDASVLDDILGTITKYGVPPILALVVALAGFLAWLKYGRKTGGNDKPSES